MKEDARDAAHQDQDDPGREPPDEEGAQSVEEGLEEPEPESHRSPEDRAVRDAPEPVAVGGHPRRLQRLLDERGEDQDEEDPAQGRVAVEENELRGGVRLARRCAQRDQDDLDEPRGDRGEDGPVDERAEQRTPGLALEPGGTTDPGEVE